jgi:hypothetical protein
MSGYEVPAVVHSAGALVASRLGGSRSIPSGVVVTAPVSASWNCSWRGVAVGLGDCNPAGQAAGCSIWKSLKPDRFPLAVRRISHGPPARYQLDKQHSDCDHEQNVDEPSEGVRTDHPEKPQNEQHYKDRPKHGPLLSVPIGSRSGVSARRDMHAHLLAVVLPRRCAAQCEGEMSVQSGSRGASRSKVR